MPITIIAEAGVNHCGSKERALEMVHAAAEAGADYVKFQTFKAEKIVSKSAPKAEYQAANDPTSGQTQLEMLKALELTIDDFKDIANECRRCGIGFLSTPFDLDSIRELEALDMDFWKVPSGEITNLPYLRAIARQGKPVVMSTGMSSLPEINAAVHALCDAGLKRDQITLLHCNTQYPTPPVDVNLRAMESLRELGCSGVGFSDHTLGIAIPLAAAALGAEFIEKHFTLSRELPGPDHKASLNPTELAEMVNGIRTIEQALGQKEKAMTESEKSNITIARKSIVASREIKKGELFTDENLTTKRPATGISPMLWDSVIGTRARRDYLPDEPIEKI